MFGERLEKATGRSGGGGIAEWLQMDGGRRTVFCVRRGPYASRVLQENVLGMYDNDLPLLKMTGVSVRVTLKIADFTKVVRKETTLI